MVVLPGVLRGGFPLGLPRRPPARAGTVLTPPGRRLTNRVYRAIVALGGAFLRLLDVRAEVTGGQHVPVQGGAVLAISHFSYLDFMLAEWAVWRERRRYTRFMATVASFEHWLVGPLMRAMRHIPVDRAAGGRAYVHAVNALEQDEIVGVFPEGKVSGTFELLPFKTGAARMAIEAGVPIVPCVLWGSHRLITRTHRTHLWRSRHLPVSIVFGEPLHPAPGADPAAVTEQLRDVMVQLLRGAQEAYPDQGAPGAWWEPAHRGGGAPGSEAAPDTAACPDTVISSR